MLALRSDMTIPIARVVATRYADAEPPLRFCYFAHAWRAVERGVGEPREFLQGGIELIGAAGARGRGRGDRADDRRARGGRPAPPPGRAWATASLYRSLLAALEVPAEEHLPLLECLSRRDLVGLEMRVVAARPGSAERERELLVRLPELRGGPEVLERADGPRGRRRRGPARAARAAGASAAWPTA